MRVRVRVRGRVRVRVRARVRAGARARVRASPNQVCETRTLTLALTRPARRTYATICSWPSTAS